MKLIQIWAEHRWNSFDAASDNKQLGSGIVVDNGDDDDLVSGD